MAEVRNITARCLDMTNNSTFVEHEVSYEVKDSGVWVSKTVRLMATDPMDAINITKRMETIP